MPLAYLTEWIGCMDVRTSNAVFQCARAVIEDSVYYAVSGNIDDSFIIDGYEIEYKMRDAFLLIFNVVLGVIEVDEVPVPVYFIDPTLFDPLTCAYIYSFPGDLYGAPCTQQRFP